MPSNKSFGLFFSFLFFIASGYLYFNSSFFLSTFFLILSSIFLLLTVFLPKLLYPLNSIWYKLGIILASITSPIVLAFLFFVFLTPIAFLLKIFGRDLLKLNFNRSSLTSYWVDRIPPGPSSDSFKNQF